MGGLNQGLFDLTPTEAKVARLVANCRTVKDIARSTGVTEETIRKQLKTVFAKTGVSRQVELATLLGGAVLPMSSFP